MSNKKPFWLIDEHILEISERKNEILSYLENNCEYYVLPYQPFLSMNFPKEIVSEQARCGIVYGSMQFVDRCTKETNLYPSSYYDYDYFHLNHYQSMFPPSYFLNHDSVFVTYSWLYNQLDYYQKLLGDRLFIRPNSPKKLFTGTVVENKDDLEMLEKTSGIVDKTLLNVSSAKHIEKEIRYFIVNGEVVSHSQYHQNHEIVITEDDDDRCRELAKCVGADSDPFYNTFVCDVGLHQSSPKVIEFNAINTSGWYLGDTNAIMSSLNDKLISEFIDYE